MRQILGKKKEWFKRKKKNFCGFFGFELRYNCEQEYNLYIKNKNNIRVDIFNILRKKSGALEECHLLKFISENPNWNVHTDVTQSNIV